MQSFVWQVLKVGAVYLAYCANPVIGIVLFALAVTVTVYP